MLNNKLNFLDGLNGPKFKRRELSPPLPFTPPPTPLSRPKSKKPWKLIISFVLVISVILIAFSSNIIFSSSSFLDNLTNIKAPNNETGLWTKIKRLVGVEEKKLSGENEDRINILLLGQGGAGHEGPFLTDTIILISLKPSTNQVAAISVPRDLYVPVSKNGWRRLNYANSYGEVELGGQGGEVASQTASEVFNLPIHYYVRIDFEGFKKIVDDLGNINVYVEKSFTDSAYPTSSYGTTTVSFEKGWQKMDGDTALKFARSRHGTNGESGDFARAKRQQKIIIAIKNKAFSFGSLFRPDKFIRAAKDFNKHFKTNLKTWEIIRLSQLIKNLNLETIITKVLDDSPEGPLVSAVTEDGAYVLKTKTDDFTELAEIVQNIFLAPSEAQVKEVEKKVEEKKQLLTKIKKEGGSANLAVQNGTLHSGFAKETADYLAGLEFKVIEFGNAPTQDLEKTIIYDFTDGKKKANLELLTKKLNPQALGDIKTKEADISDFPGLNPATDFLIILGADYTEPATTPSPLSPPLTNNPQINPQIPTSTIQDKNEQNK